MKAKIDRDGFLTIERQGVYIQQYCPYLENRKCGHDCPMFLEPYPTHDAEEQILQICKKVLYFDSITDERKRS